MFFCSLLFRILSRTRVISICGKIYEATDLPVKVFPVLPAKDYPLSEQNRERYAKGLEQVTKFFRENKIFQEPV